MQNTKNYAVSKYQNIVDSQVFSIRLLSRYMLHVQQEHIHHMLSGIPSQNF